MNRLLFSRAMPVWMRPLIPPRRTDRRLSAVACLSQRARQRIPQTKAALIAGGGTSV